MDVQINLPKTMRALYFCPASTAITDSTDPSLPRVDSEIVLDSNFPSPKPSPGQYLIKVQAAAFSDDELRLAKALNPSKSIPQVPLHNFCGTVVRTPIGDGWNPNGSKFRVNDIVFGLIRYTHDGAAADYVVASEDEIALKPRTISVEEAATIPLPALTAWQALFKYAGLDPADTSNGGQRDSLRVLITNAVDSEIAVQALHLLRSPSLFPHFRPWICATCRSEEQAASLRKSEFQVDKTVVSRALIPWVNSLSVSFRMNSWDPVDIVLDCAGNSSFKGAHSRMVVKDGGAVLTAVDSTPIHNDLLYEDSQSRERNLLSRFISVEPDGETLARISRMVDDENEPIQGRVESIMDLADGVKILASDALLEKHRTRGGIMVFRVND